MPANESQANLVDDGDVTAAQQWVALDAYIAGDDYLSTRRGQFAERNAARSNWAHIVDLKFLQDFTLKKNTLQLSFDIFNFTNLLNKEWGKVNFRPSNSQPIRFEDFEADDTTPTFSFDPNTAANLDRVDDSGILSSRWQMQIGLRYIFN